MELSLAKKERIELEEEVKKLIKEFESHTSAIIKYIDVRRSYINNEIRDIQIVVEER